MPNQPQFPLYRKYHNNSSYFKINSFDSFVELKRMPKGFVLYEFSAKILPDRNYIHDMIFDYELYWNEIDKNEFEAIQDTIDI